LVSGWFEIHIVLIGCYWLPPGKMIVEAASNEAMEHAFRFGSTRYLDETDSNCENHHCPRLVD